MRQYFRTFLSVWIKIVGILTAIVAVIGLLDAGFYACGLISKYYLHDASVGQVSFIFFICTVFVAAIFSIPDKKVPNK